MHLDYSERRVGEIGTTAKNILVAVAAVVAAILLGFGYVTFYRTAYPVMFGSAVTQASEETGLAQSLIYSVIRTESGFHPEAQSSVGARGLMQITPDTLSWVRYRIGESGAADSELLFEPDSNIYYGSHTLSLLLDEFGSVETALAAYHAGWGNVTRWLESEEYSADGKTLHTIPFGDTDRYVSKVLETAQIYCKLYNNLLQTDNFNRRTTE